MFKRKEKKQGYKVETVGNLIVEKVQLPHTLVEADGSEYNIVTWTYTLKIDNGRELVKGRYGTGSEESLKKMNGTYITPFIEVRSEYDALLKFYDKLSYMFARL